MARRQASRTVARAVIACVAAVTAVAVGCSASPEVVPDTRTGFPLDAARSALAQVAADAEARRAWRVNALDERMATCLAAADVDEPGAALVPDPVGTTGRGLDVVSRASAGTHGYGLARTTWDEAVAAAADTERPRAPVTVTGPSAPVRGRAALVRLRALYGQLHYVEESDPRFSIPGWGECYERSLEVLTSRTLDQSLHDRLVLDLDELTADVLADERVLAADEHWGACMAERTGLELARPAEAPELIAHEVALHTHLGARHSEDDALAARAADRWPALQAREIAVASADAACRAESGWDDVMTAARAEHEDRFADRRSDLLRDVVDGLARVGPARGADAPADDVRR